MTLEDLRDNPTLVVENLKIKGPGGVRPTSTITVSTTVVTPKATDVHRETIDIRTDAVVSASAAAGDRQGDSQWVNVTATGAANCYWLPWGEGKVFLGRLGLAHQYFFTYAINGCGVLIGGTTAQPIVAHANLDCKRLNDAVTDAMKFGKNAGAVAAKDQALIYEQFYGNLAAKLIQDDELSGVRLEVVTPQQYLIDSGASFGAVFGINKAGAWEFFGNWAKKTRKIWP